MVSRKPDLGSLLKADSAQLQARRCQVGIVSGDQPAGSPWCSAEPTRKVAAELSTHHSNESASLLSFWDGCCRPAVGDKLCPRAACRQAACALRCDYAQGANQCHTHAAHQQMPAREAAMHPGASTAGLLGPHLSALPARGGSGYLSAT